MQLDNNDTGEGGCINFALMKSQMAMASSTSHTSDLNSSCGKSQPLAPIEASPKPRKARRMRRLRCDISHSFVAVLGCFIALLSAPSQITRHGGVLVEAGNNYYQYGGNYNYENYQGNNQNNGGGGGGQYNYNYNDDGNGGNNDDAAYDDYYGNGDDGKNNYNNDDNDDANDDANDDGGYNVYNNDDVNDDGDDGADKGYSDAEEAAYANADDDVFHWNSNVGFDGVSVMPISCIN